MVYGPRMAVPPGGFSALARNGLVELVGVWERASAAGGGTAPLVTGHADDGASAEDDVVLKDHDGLSGRDGTLGLLEVDANAFGAMLRAAGCPPDRAPVRVVCRGLVCPADSYLLVWLVVADLRRRL